MKHPVGFVLAGVIALVIAGAAFLLRSGGGRTESKRPPANLDGKSLEENPGGLRSDRRNDPDQINPTGSGSEQRAAYIGARDKALQSLALHAENRDFAGGFEAARKLIRSNPTTIEEKAESIVGVRALSYFAQHHSSNKEEAYRLLKGILMDPSADAIVRKVAIASVAGIAVPREDWAPLAVRDPKTNTVFLDWEIRDDLAKNLEAYDGDGETVPSSRSYLLLGHLKDWARKDLQLSTWLMATIRSQTEEDLESHATGRVGLLTGLITLTAAIGNPDAIPIIGQSLAQGQDFWTRYAASHALVEFVRLGHDSAAAALLSRGVTDAHPSIRAVAIEDVFDRRQLSVADVVEIFRSVTTVPPAIDLADPFYRVGVLRLAFSGFREVLQYCSANPNQSEYQEIARAFITNMAAWRTDEVLTQLIRALTTFTYKSVPYDAIATAISSFPDTAERQAALKALEDHRQNRGR